MKRNLQDCHTVGWTPWPTRGYSPDIKFPIRLYVTRWALAVVVAGACAAVACAARGPATPQPFPRPGGSTSGEAASRPSTRGEAIARTALALVGTPYRYGGGDARGFDCSGLVQYVFRQHGAQVPRDVSDQYRSRLLSDVRQLRPGDLLFFSTISRGASHVAIALGGRRFVHAPSTGGAVRVENLDVRYWSRRLIGARRLAAD